MKIEVTVHHHNEECCARIECKVDQALVQLDRVLAQQERILEREAQMAATIDDILAGVQQESTVDDSIITLLNNIAAQLANAGVPQDKIDAIMAVITANQAKVTAAVTANTPAAPPPTP